MRHSHRSASLLPRALSLLLAAAAAQCLAGLCHLTFVAGGAGSRRGTRQGWRPAREASAEGGPTSEAEVELLSSLDFALASKCSDEEVSAVAKQLAETPDVVAKIWSSAGYSDEALIGQKEFAKFARQVGIEGPTQAMQAAFSVIANGAGYCEKFKFEDEVQGWQGSPQTFSATAFQLSFLRARSWVAFGYAWLYGMSTFCGAFFFGRPIIFSLIGFDLFPGLRQWWIAP
mmetsp:Transcript_57585/g.136938  ORF Transcript_57585/g.136938 Transcript_57585/m.136938 type:complete len:230 (+) Transcript_57585:83-772(+)